MEQIMSEIWKPQSHLVYENWINAVISEASDRLNDWETKFIEAMRERVVMKLNITQAMAEKLEQIYVQYTN
jgi:hypothetical protein